MEKNVINNFARHVVFPVRMLSRMSIDPFKLIQDRVSGALVDIETTSYAEEKVEEIREAIHNVMRGLDLTPDEAAKFIQRHVWGLLESREIYTLAMSIGYYNFKFNDTFYILTKEL